MQKPKLISFNAVPGVDPYTGDLADIALSIWIDKETGVPCMAVGEVYRQGAVEADVFHNRTQCLTINQIGEYGEYTAPKAEPLRHYLEEGLGFCRILEFTKHFTIDWDGNNMVGKIAPEGHRQLDTMLREIKSLPDQRYELWDVEDWFQHTDIMADTTDEELEALANEREDGVVVKGDVLKHLKERRQAAQEN